MLENFLADELTLAVAIGREPNPFGGAQCLANGFELGGFVAAVCRASAVKPFGPQQDRRPALPGRHDIFRLEQVQQMTLGRKDFSVTRTDSGADVFRLAGFLRDDDLIGHGGFVSKDRFDSGLARTYSEQNRLASRICWGQAACDLLSSTDVAGPGGRAQASQVGSRGSNPFA